MKTYPLRKTTLSKSLLLLSLFALVTFTSTSASFAQDTPPSFDDIPFVSQTDRSVTIANTKIERTIIIENGKAHTASIRNGISYSKLPAAPHEFELTLMDGTKLTSSDFDYKGSSTKYVAAGAVELTMSYSNAALGIEAEAVYLSRPNENLMRKKIRLRAAGAPVHVDSLTVDILAGKDSADNGGHGQPVYLDRHVFAGIEDPSGYNIVEPGKIAKLIHYPGWILDSQWKESKTAVIGISRNYEVREEFFRYIESIARKPKPIVVYNSWFDVRRDNMSVEFFKKTFDTFKLRMNTNLDSLVIDDGWQDLNALWEPQESNFPEGFEGLSAYLQSLGSHLGLWMPLCGYGLDLPFSPPAGFEVSPQGNYFCLAGDNYREALKNQLKYIVSDLKVNYLKHDFNFLKCTGDKPGHRATDLQSIEANTDAEIELLDYMHALNPDVFLNVTSYVWLSPWWLRHADALWIGSSDYGWNRTVPAFDKRNQSNTYYDEFIYRRIREERAQIKPHILMTHGIIDARLNRLGGEDEDYKTWVDNVMLYLGRGVMMRELYLSPDTVPQDRWDALSQALNWAATQNDIFTNGEMLGGNPSRGEAYWYHFTKGERELFTLRAPSHFLGGFKMQLRSSDRLVHVIYPYNMWLLGDFIDGLSRAFIETPGHSVTIIEAVPPKDIIRPVVTGVMSKLVRQSETDTEYDVTSLPTSTMIKIQSGVKINSVVFDGKPLDEVEGAYETVFAEDKNFFRKKPLNPGAWPEPSSFTFRIDTGIILEKPVTNARTVFVAKANEGEPPGTILFDGSPLTAQYAGPGWNAFIFPADYGTTTHRIEYSTQTFYATPFATSSFAVDVFSEGDFPGITKRLIIKHDPAPLDTSIYPPLPLQDKFRNVIVNMHDFEVSLKDVIPKRDLSAQDLAGVKAAKIRLKVYGHRPARATPRTLTINGSPATMIPYNSFPHDLWEDFVLDASPSSLKAIKKENRIVVNNLGGDPFKFKDVTLSVQLADGTWATSDTSYEVQYTGDGWEYAEGEKFKSASKARKIGF